MRGVREVVPPDNTGWVRDGQPEGLARADAMRGVRGVVPPDNTDSAR
jgi:hypothetical protein